MRILIEVSARHCHISKKDLEKLFGKGFELQKLKDLSQKGEFASKQTLTLKNKDGEIQNIRILGPTRDQTQIELSATDARKLKINPPIRLSGDLKGSEKGTIMGPKGKIMLKEGIIIAQRHVHCDPKTAKKLKLKNKQKISIKTTGPKSLTFHNVPVRIKEKYVFGMHIDTDEGNAALPRGICAYGKIIK